MRGRYPFCFYGSLLDCLISKQHVKTIKDLFERALWFGIQSGNHPSYRIQPELKNDPIRSILL